VTDSVLLVERDGDVVTVTLNRPASLNALSVELMRALAQTFRSLQRDASIRAVILTGAGRAFCAGLDLKELGRSGGIAGLKLGEDDDLEGPLLAFDRPIVCAVNGAAVTGGLELVLMCDIVIASSAARFADTHTRVAVTPSWGMSQRLPRLIGINRARDMSFSARFVDAHEATAWGLASRVVEPDALMPTCRAIAADIAQADADTVRDYKRLFAEGGGMNLAESMRFEKVLHRESAQRATAEHVARRAEALLGRKG